MAHIHIRVCTHTYIHMNEICWGRDQWPVYLIYLFTYLPITEINKQSLGVMGLKQSAGSEITVAVNWGDCFTSPAVGVLLRKWSGVSRLL